MTPDLLFAIFTAQPLCRECDAPAYFRFKGSPLCVEHFNSVIASGSASSGDDVTAGVGQPPAVAPAVTDPFESCGGVEGHAQLSEEAPRRGVAEKRSPDKRQCSAQARPAGIKPGPQDFPFSKNATVLRVAANSGIQSPKSSSDISSPSSASA